jgi:drug/metabolite transporter (DMT)-like permease
VIFGVVQMGLPYVLFAKALRSVSVQEAALVTLIEPVLNPLWVRLLWGETVGAATWAGGALILAGLAVRYAASAARAPRGPA